MIQRTARLAPLYGIGEGDIKQIIVSYCCYHEKGNGCRIGQETREDGGRQRRQNKKTELRLK